MKMTQVERIKQILVDYTKRNHIMASSVILENYAEELVKNGVVIPPVKVGQTIYVLWSGGRKGKGIAEFQVRSINLDTPDDMEIVYRSKKLNATMCRYANASDIGKTLFLSREEAEQALEREMARGYEKSSC
jgi:hypothetical protein